MTKYRCLKCSVIFDGSRDRCPNCGNYAIYCQEFEEVYRPHLTKESIVNSTDEATFKKGVELYENGCVSKLEIDEYNLNAYARVLSLDKSHDYGVQVSFTEEGETGAFQCQCPDFYRRQHVCKHIIAFKLRLLEEDKK